MEQDTKILAFIKKAKKRIRRQKFWRVFCIALIAGMIIWGLINTVALFIPIYKAILIGMGAMIVCVIAGIIAGPFFAPSIEQTAKMIDGKGFKERVSTAYELKGKDDFYSNLHKRDTCSQIQNVSMKKLFPGKLSKKVMIIMFASFLFVVATAMAPAKTREEAQEIHEVNEEKKDVTAQLEEVKKEVEEKYDLSDEERAHLEEMLDEAKSELKKAESQEEISKIKDRFESKVETQIVAPEIKNEAKAIENALNQLEGNKKDLAEQQEIAQQLEDLAKEAEDEELQNIAEQIQQELGETGEISDEIKEQAKQQLQNIQNGQKPGAVEIGQDPNAQQGQQGQQGRCGV